MNTSEVSPLPPRPNLEQYKKQAKDLLKRSKSGNAELILDTLAGAQLVIAREHGFQSWPKFAAHVTELARKNSPVSQFECAVEAIVTGNAVALESLLEANPDLIRTRSTRIHRGALLHYLGANGFENYRQKSPPNAVEIAAILLSAGAEVDAVADVYGKSTTLGLVATSIHPKRAGVQLPLLQILIDHGAAVDGIAGMRSPLISALHNGRPEAAEFLAQHGAKLNLEAAAGLGRLDLVATFFNEDSTLKNATQTEMEAGFLWACEYGHNSVVDFLLSKGVNLRTGENTGMTGLHWAVAGGQLETVKLLLERGAPLEAQNVYGGTALGQARWSSLNGDPRIDYRPIMETLIRAGAKP